MSVHYLRLTTPDKRTVIVNEKFAVYLYVDTYIWKDGQGYHRTPEIICFNGVETHKGLRIEVNGKAFVIKRSNRGVKRKNIKGLFFTDKTSLLKHIDGQKQLINCYIERQSVEMKLLDDLLVKYQRLST